MLDSLNIRRSVILAFIIISLGCTTTGSETTNRFNPFSRSSTTSETDFKNTNPSLNTVKANDNKLNDLTIVPKNITVLSDEGFYYSVLPTNKDKTSTSKIQFNWKTLDDSVGTINDSGYFRAGKNPGHYPNAIMVEISQIINGMIFKEEVYATVNIIDTFNINPITRIELTPKVANIIFGEPYLFKAMAYDALGTPILLAEYKWYISDNNIGTISDTGFFRSKKLSGNFKDIIRVKVIQEIDGHNFIREETASIDISFKKN